MWEIASDASNGHGPSSREDITRASRIAPPFHSQPVTTPSRRLSLRLALADPASTAHLPASILRQHRESISTFDQNYSNSSSQDAFRFLHRAFRGCRLRTGRHGLFCYNHGRLSRTPRVHPSDRHRPPWMIQDTCCAWINCAILSDCNPGRSCRQRQYHHHQHLHILEHAHQLPLSHKFRWCDHGHAQRRWRPCSRNLSACTRDWCVIHSHLKFANTMLTISKSRQGCPQESTQSTSETAARLAHSPSAWELRPPL